MTNRLGLFSFVTTAVVMTAAAKPPEAVSTRRAGCGSGSTSWAFVAAVRGMVSDTSLLSQYGLSVPPDSSGVALLTTTAVCDSVIAAHNAHVAPDTSSTAATPFIVQAGTSYFLDLAKDSGSITYVYDSTFTYKSFWIQLD